MKHIKAYGGFTDVQCGNFGVDIKLFESFDDHQINRDIEDICLELVDNGFSWSLIGVNLKSIVDFGVDDFSIEIIKGYKPSHQLEFKFSEIEDVVERLKSYLESFGYNCIKDAKKIDSRHVISIDDDIWTYTMTFFL